jgi:superfamily II DNA or RNA helicase
MNAESKSLNTYLGQKGYTILKKELTNEQQKKIKEDLTIKPFTIGGLNNIQNVFSVYRESVNKIYLPHYYGIENYGNPKEYKITDGADIDLNFAGTLRDYQEPVVNKFIKHCNENKYGGGLLELPCAWGKCLGKDTPVLMFDGKIKLVQYIDTNDLLMGDDSTPRRVLSLARGREQMYKIGNNIGESYICNESHILSLKCLETNEIIDISVRDYLELPKNTQETLYGYKVSVDFSHHPINYNSSSAGFWIGCTYLSKKDDNKFGSLNYAMNIHNLIDNQHISFNYLCNTRENRLLLLAGLIDSPASKVFENNIEIKFTSETLIDDVIFLARSLGFASYKKLQTFYDYKNEENIFYIAFIYGYNFKKIPCLQDKDNKYNGNLMKKCKDVENALYSKIKIEKLGVDHYYGFEIDGNKRFVLGDFTVTHNTSGSLYICSQLKKKTLVIVHKEFLMNQWIERIHQFLPMARIGRIQASTIDIEDKDIVLCMLQSLISKDYEQSIFDGFGLTIIDEVHHISSKTFSNALFKVVTKYMLGLSATMERKDGTTNVFKMFLGSILYKTERKKETSVEVRALTYKVKDDDFNEVIYDYRGQPQNSSMINKLCEYNRRTEFIIRTLCDFIRVEDIDEVTAKQFKIDMDKLVPNCNICKTNNNYLVRNTCCDVIKYCMLCMEDIETISTNNTKIVKSADGKERTRREKSKCPNCKKALKYEQNYIENPHVKPLEQTHTIIMAHNLSILHYIYKKFVCKNLASVGYYIGGMNESELKKSEKKQVILASYSMSAEGLDIPTLNAEFLITPKTDVIQIVGRILRAKHEFSHPIIYDFVDSHDLFQRQWLKRKTYYKKQGYTIVGTDSMNYDSNIEKWKTIYDSNIIDKRENELKSGKCLIPLKNPI